MCGSMALLKQTTANENIMKIGNNYGAGLTVQDCFSMFGNRGLIEAAETKNNLAVRIYLGGRGFNRVNRSFADAVISFLENI